MRGAFLLSAALALGALASLPRAAAEPPEPAAEPAAVKRGLELVSSYHLAAEPLTTEKVWALDPEELNPHRARWVLNRQVRLKGLEPRKLPNKAFGVHAKAFESVSMGYIRGAGPWYRPLSEFPCTANPSEESWFATLDGSRKAADIAGKAWNELIKKERLTLELQLERIRESSEANAVRRAFLIYEAWLRRLEKAWNTQGKRSVRAAEWREYDTQATEAGICKKGEGGRTASAGALTRPRWEAIMEPPLPPLSGVHAKPLARAPARRWNGLFSVRLTVQVGARSLTGQFLIDSTTEKSILSPAWLTAQGLLPPLVQLPGSPLERANLSSISGLGARALVDSAKLAGEELELKEFVLYEVDIYGPPENIASCCDGVLGRDFLRKYVVEFRPGLPAEVLLWPREGFRLPWDPAKSLDTRWIEASLEMTGAPESRCRLERAGQPARARPVRWDTGAEKALIAKDRGTGFTLKCGESQHLIAQDLDAQVGSQASGQVLTVGMPVIGRGPVIFDLPHGRIWFSGEALAEPIAQNRSGLELAFSYPKGERTLKVAAIRKGSPAEALEKEGLKPGTRIEQIDSTPVEEMDAWEIEQRLAGVYGHIVTLQWGSKDSVKIVPLKLR